MRKRIIALVLTCALILGMIPASTSGAATKSLFKDVNGHWGQEAIERIAQLGIIQGHQGRFNPDKAITRGELAIILDNIMNYQTMAKNDLVDLGDTYYTEAVLKVNEAKVMVGFNNKFRPTDNITREEAIVTLSRAFGIPLARYGRLAQFSDSPEVSSWAFEAIKSMVSKKYITGNQGKLLPTSNITRAEVVTILDNIIKAMYSEKGEYTTSVDGTAIISAKGVTLRDLRIKGDLIITEGVADGEITLDNVKVEGNTIVRGGGVNSVIVLEGFCELRYMMVESNVTIKNKSESIISNFEVKANGVTFFGCVPKNVVVNANVIVKPVDSRGKEVTQTVVTSTPPVKRPTNAKVSVVKGAEVIVKGEDDRWTWFDNGTPLLTVTIPDNTREIRHYSILASKNGGEWYNIWNEDEENDGTATFAVNLLDELTESGVYKFMVVSVAKNWNEDIFGEFIVTDTFKYTISNEEIGIPKAFTTNRDYYEIGIKLLEKNKLYQLYFFDNNGTEIYNRQIAAENGAYYGGMPTDMKSIKIRKIDATETTEGVDLVITKLQESTIPVEINNLPIDPVHPEFGEYLPPVIDLRTVFNVDKDEFKFSFKLPTDLSELAKATIYLFKTDGTYTDTYEFSYNYGSSEWNMFSYLIRQEKTVSFTKLGVVSEPYKESVKLASITYVDTDITVNVAEKPLTGYDASISIDKNGARVLKITGLESNKKYCVNTMDGIIYNAYCKSNDEGIATLSYYRLVDLTEESKILIQKYEIIADSNKYTINLTPKGKDGVNINLNGH
ncbi:MAG: beta-propeller protein methanol dehydrogenase [Clostridiales bacterium]|jgi:hypothetical protein|nr:beta-propeller protein methanol dehydrogenase [Clostridiales bacterium]